MTMVDIKHIRNGKKNGKNFCEVNFIFKLELQYLLLKKKTNYNKQIWTNVNVSTSRALSSSKLTL